MRQERNFTCRKIGQIYSGYNFRIILNERVQLLDLSKIIYKENKISQIK